MSNKFEVGDRVALTVSLSDREGGKGTVGGVHGDTADVEMDNGHWATVLSCHLYRVVVERHA
jgi:hypothetical protein